MRQVFFDLETTGLKFNEGAKIIQVAMIEYIDGKPTGRFLNEMVNPHRSIEPGAFEVHGITSEMLKDKPTLKDILPKILEFIQDAELVAHNGKKFDAPFLNKEFKNIGFDKTLWQCCKTVTDTLLIAKKLYPRQRNKLDDLCDRLEVDRSNRGKHDALKDTELLAQVFFRMKELNPEFDMYKNTFDVDVMRDPIEKIVNKPKLKVVLASDEENNNHNNYMIAMAPKVENKLKM